MKWSVYDIVYPRTKEFSEFVLFYIEQTWLREYVDMHRGEEKNDLQYFLLEIVALKANIFFCL